MEEEQRTARRAWGSRGQHGAGVGTTGATGKGPAAQQRLLLLQRTLLPAGWLVFAVLLIVLAKKLFPREIH